MSLALSAQKTEDLPAKVAQQQAQIRWLELRVKDLETSCSAKNPRSGPIPVTTAICNGMHSWVKCARWRRSLRSRPPQSRRRGRAGRLA